MGKRAYFTAPTGADDGGKRSKRWFLLTIRSLRCGRAAREAKFQTAFAAVAAYCAAILGISDKSRYNAILLLTAGLPAWQFGTTGQGRKPAAHSDASVPGVRLATS